MFPKNSVFTSKKTLLINERVVSPMYPVVMGVLNITPDSFYQSSRINELNLVQQISKMINEGAFIIDVGAISSRPGSKFISDDDEWYRLNQFFNLARKHFPETIFSVDTFRSEIAHKLHEFYNVQIINDISAGRFDTQIFKTIALTKQIYIAMHSRGSFDTMHQSYTYKNITKEVIQELAIQISMAKESGIVDLIIDPGFGFSKSVEQNFQLLNQLAAFSFFELPLLVGLSRKSMIYITLNSTPENALNGTTILNTIALINGASILRVHDVKEAHEAIEIVKKLETFNIQ